MGRFSTVAFFNGLEEGFTGMTRHNAKKEAWIKDVCTGNVYSDFVAGIKNLRKEQDMYFFLLYDKTGEIEAKLHSSTPVDAIAEGEEVVVNFSFIRKEGHKIAMVKALRRADPHSDNYNAMDLYTGLDSKHADSYRVMIRNAIDYVKKYEQKRLAARHQEGHYHSLLTAYYTEEEFEILACRPASVNGVGRYLGGALALVVNVTYAAKDVAIEFHRLGNGLYPVDMDYALIITAALLCMAGMRDYVGPDLKKTRRGIARGYYGLLQERLLPLCRDCQLSGDEEDKILNTLMCIFPGCGAIKSVTVESSLLRGIYALYGEVDEAALFQSESPDEVSKMQGYCYSEQLNKPFLIDRQEEEAGTHERIS